MAFKGHSSFNFALLFGFSISCLCLQPKIFATVPPHYNQYAQFPIGGDEVEKRIRFWEKIFTVYPSTSVLIHDIDDPSFIVDIVDFKELYRKNKKINLSSRKEREKIAQSYIKRYKLALKRFEKSGKDALRYGAMEHRVYNVFKRTKDGYARLMRGDISLRNQAGLSDEFVEAAKRAQEYLPFMEKIFKDHGLPVKITRLAFVESMFNLNAKSKVGASGIWQFMPDTGRIYLHVNRLVDERNSPFKATIAAAELLSENYSDLKSWPLAITAYNHGKGGMMRAVKLIHTQDLSTLIRYYHAPTFRYASKNFYAEFMAAAGVYDSMVAKKIIKTTPKDYLPKILTLEKSYTINDILKNFSLSKEILQSPYQGIRSEAFTTYKNQKLPENFVLFLPPHIKVKTSIANKKDGRKHRK